MWVVVQDGAQALYHRDMELCPSDWTEHPQAGRTMFDSVSEERAGAGAVGRRLWGRLSGELLVVGASQARCFSPCPFKDDLGMVET